MRMLGLFIATSFVAIFATTTLLSTFLSNYMVRQMMMRDAVVSMEFLNSIVRVEDANHYFFGETQRSDVPEMEEFFVHVSRLPDVFRANVYAQSGEIIWSSDPELIGKTFEENDELESAMKGELHPEVGLIDRGQKDEHVGFPSWVTQFIEYYVPIWSKEGSFVVGAVEVYKAPAALLATANRINTLAWTGAALAGAVLFAGLLVVVFYSTRILQRQEARLIETERLAVVGEMASAVAHGLRNPLAAIRSCAELTLDDDLPETSRESVHDIVNQVDRLEGWIRSFLSRAREEPGQAQNIAQIDLVVQKCISNFRAQMKKRGIVLEIEPGTENPVVSASASELEQVLNSVISNAIESMSNGGKLTIGWDTVPGRRLAIRVSDTGEGISEEMLSKLFVPFQTGKSSGLGVGLALSRRIAERLGGSLDLANRPDKGVDVTFVLPSKA